MANTVGTVQVRTVTALWLLLSSLASLLGIGGVVSAARFSNPLDPYFERNPYVIFSEGYYYYLTESPEFTRDLRITRSTTLDGLKNGQTKVIADSNPDYSFGSAELHKIDGKWWIYFEHETTEFRKPDYQSIAIFEGGASVREPFQFVGRLTNTTLSNWPTILRFPDQLYMVYACRPSLQDPGTASVICIAPMLSPTSLGPSRILINATEPWELVSAQYGPQLGAPSAFYHAGRTFLSYDVSGLPFGLLTYKGLGDPMSAASWVKSGPHHSIGLRLPPNTTCYTTQNKFFSSPDETEVWMAYNLRSRNGYCWDYRHTGAKIVEWNPDGSPNFETPGLLERWGNGPSGE